MIAVSSDFGAYISVYSRVKYADQKRIMSGKIFDNMLIIKFGFTIVEEKSVRYKLVSIADRLDQYCGLLAGENSFPYTWSEQDIYLGARNIIREYFHKISFRLR